MTHMRTSERGSAVLVVLLMLVALAGIQSAVGQFGNAVEKQLRVQELRHNQAFADRYPARAAN